MAGRRLNKRFVKKASPQVSHGAAGDKASGNVSASRMMYDAFYNAATRAGILAGNQLSYTSYVNTRYSNVQYQEMTNLYRTNWLVGKIIDVPATDMVKVGYRIITQLNPDLLDKISAAERRMGLREKLIDGITWGRLYGGAVGIMMVKGHENILDRPLDYTDVALGAFKGMIVVDRWNSVTPSTDRVNDISSPDFGLPEYYDVLINEGTACRVHCSRIVRFTGKKLPYIEAVGNQFWGMSEVERIEEEVKKYNNVGWNIASLTFLANLRTLKIEGLGENVGIGGERAQNKLYDKISAINQLMNNNGLQVLSEKDDYQQYQYNFGGLPEVYDRFMMDLAGAANIPVTKFFGRSPAGMNATGESDMQNYAEYISGQQEYVLRPALNKILPLLFVSELGAIPDDLHFEFNSVIAASESEKEDMASKRTSTVTSAMNAGLITDEIALKELRQVSSSTGVWTNITDRTLIEAQERNDLSRKWQELREREEALEEKKQIFQQQKALLHERVGSRVIIQTPEKVTRDGDGLAPADDSTDGLSGGSEGADDELGMPVHQKIPIPAEPQM